MDYRILGKTGLSVSVAGLGAGGHSRLGQAQGHSTAQSVRLVHAALDLGINFVDTARNYGTQDLVGEALAGRRERVVLSTKTHLSEPPLTADGRYLTSAELRRNLEDSLRRLRTDHVDIYHLHGVEPRHFGHCILHVVPVLMRLKEEGKLRFIGITERFSVDTGHVMLSRAVEAGVFDVVMLGFNMLNPCARERVLPATQGHGIGTLNMFAVRRALTDATNLQHAIAPAIAAGQIDAALLQTDDPLAFLTEDGAAASLTQAAYRFCRHEPGIDVVLTGTGNIDHLKDNVAAINGPPLPAATQQRLRLLFGAVDSISGD